MDPLNLILARTGISITIEKMRNSSDEIKKKTPHRNDLISSLEKSISDLTFSYVYFCELEAEFRVSRQRNGDLEFGKFQQMQELEKLREQNKNLIEGL